MIALRCSRCTPPGPFNARWSGIALLLAALGATHAAAGTVVGVSMTDPSIVSSTAGGELGNKRGRMLSDDGRWLVFTSRSPDLVPGYTGTGQQVYLYDRQTDAVTLVSGSNGSPAQGGNVESSQPVISGNGAYVAFLSSATDLVAGGSGPSNQNVYVWERSSGTTTLVSESASAAGQHGNGLSDQSVISGDGAYVAFVSHATDLVPGGNGPSTSNVYVWERASGTTTLVSESVSAAGQRGNNGSGEPVISGDGATVAFSGAATDLVPGSSGPGASNVYVWERSSGTTTLVSESVSAAGQRGNGYSYNPVMSGNGAYVAFYGGATDLVAGGSGPSTYNVYLWDRSSGTTTLVSESVSAAGRRGNSISYQPVISGDGAWVAFKSSATDLVAGGSGPSIENVYVWERSSGTTTLVSESVSAAGQRGNNVSVEPVISGDGATVAFYGTATDLVSGSSGPGASNVYVWDRSSGMTTLVSESMLAAGRRGNTSSYRPVISGDGAYVAFFGNASDLVAGDGTGADVFLGEVATGTLVAASRRDPGTAWAPATGNEVSFLGPSRFRSISSNGAYVAFLSSATDLVAGGSGPASQNVYVWDRASGTTTLVSESVSAAGQRGNGTSQMAVISGDGAFVAFLSTATDLVSGGSGPSAQNVYVWERSSGTTTLVSESVAAAGQRGNSHSYNPVISGDGTTVAFFSQATDLVLGGSGPAGNPDVYVWERSSGTTTLVSESVAVAGQRGNGYSYNPVISGDGATVAFYSYATDLVPGGSGPSTVNVYLWERSSETTTLVSEAAWAAGQRGNGSSSEPVISGDGAWVAFKSSATDLVSVGSGPSTENVYVWERSSGTTTLVSESLSVAGQRGDSDSYQPAISGNGTTVAFYSYAMDLVPGGSGPSNLNVYVWERSSGTTKLVSESVSMAGQRGDSDSYDPVLSGDGAAVAFTSQATDLVVGGIGPPAQNAYVWDRSSGTTTLVSESVSAAGQRGDSDSSQPVISGDGGHVAFQSDATDLISRDFNYTTDVFLWSSGAPVDTTAPTDPTIGSTSPAASAWSNDNTVEVSWSGAADEVGGSGIAGYSIEWNTTPISTPDTVVDVVHSVDPHSTTSSLLADGDDHYFHLSTCDIAGNCTATVHAGPFWIDAAAPGAPGAVASSSHDPTATPVSDTTIDVAWGAASDALSGVASYTYAFDGSPSGSCLGSSTVSLSTTSAALGDGSWYVHVCAVDLAGNIGAAAHGGPWTVDTTPPVGLAVSSSSHTVATWSNDNTVDFGFSGATDGSGVAGYAVVYDQATGTGPACAATQAASTFTGSSSPDADDWWIHVRAIDNAGNCGATVHLGPFQVDTQDPAAPTGLASPSHDVGVASNDDTVDVEWTAALDQAGLSGIDGYGFFFSTGEDDDCDELQDGEEDVLAATSAALADGEHYFHLCAADNAGNWSPVTSIGPFVIDTAGASVIAIGTVADTGDGELAEGEATAVGVTQLAVEFDDAMFDGSGDTDPADVTNPSNYRLYQAGTDGAVQTVACGTPVGDDVEVAFAAASYSASTTTTALSLSSSLALPRESYRLLVCATLEDDAGTTIAGFTRNFTVQTTDRFANPNFDHDLAGWVVTEPSPGSLLWSSSDLSSAPTSGSAEIVTASGASAVWTLSQCLPISANPVEMSGWTQVESSIAGAPLVGARIDFFNGSGCSGAVVGSTLSPPVAGDTAGLRTYLRLTRSSPPAAALSVLVSMEVEGGAAAIFTARLDDLFYGSTPSLFADGFESSGTGAWSVTVP